MEDPVDLLTVLKYVPVVCRRCWLENLLRFKGESN